MTDGHHIASGIRNLIQEIFEAGSVTSGHLPDHSFLTWEYRLPDEIADSETTSNDNSCFIKYNLKNIPNDSRY